VACWRLSSFTVPLISVLIPPFLSVACAWATTTEVITSAFLPGAACFRACASDDPVPQTVRLDSGQSCTIVYAADDDIALAGNNEDWTGLFAKIHFIPASEGKLGRVYFGFNVVRFPQGGMNEEGLFFDAATAEVVQVPRDPSKPDHGHKMGLIFKAMEECTTVDEVIGYFKRYDFSGQCSGQYLVGDRFGNSAIIEPLTVIRKTGRYQVVTNFLQSKTPPEISQEPRYRLAETLLSKSDDVSIDLMRRVLSATHWEEYSGSMTVTLYSYICDLKRGEIYIYNFHDFDQAAKINLKEELAKGESIRTIASLFPYETFAERRYKAWRIVGLLHDRAVENGLEGLDGVIAYYNDLRSGSDGYDTYEVTESELNALGYLLLQEERTELAVGVFKLCVAEHPESANAYDSLGEAYAADGKKELAMQSYERSLELDPSNENAQQKLDSLRR
jgi:tetratricopeptide (TPR) repeat protein